MDPDLSWRSHISSVCARAKKLTGFIYRTFKLAGSPCLSHLYKSVVLPVLDYSSRSIWDPPQKCHITALERTQNFAARVVSNIWSGDSSTIKARLGWPALAKRRLFQKICLCKRVLSDSSLVPPSIFHAIQDQGLITRIRWHSSVPTSGPLIIETFLPSTWLTSGTGSLRRLPQLCPL